MIDPRDTQAGFEFSGWAVVELMGRAIIAGRVETITAGNTLFWRVDVPKVGTIVPGPFSKIYSSAAIWCVTPVTEDIAKMTLLKVAPKPLKIISEYSEF